MVEIAASVETEEDFNGAQESERTYKIFADKCGEGLLINFCKQVKKSYIYNQIEEEIDGGDETILFQLINVDILVLMSLWLWWTKVKLSTFFLTKPTEQSEPVYISITKWIHWRKGLKMIQEMGRRQSQLRQADSWHARISTQTLV